MEEELGNLNFSEVGSAEFLKTIDEMVAKELENINYRDIVSRKFEELNMGVDRIVIPSMQQSQRVFDEILQDVERLEAEEKILGKELQSLITADVIVLDDDDDEPETKEEVDKSETSMEVDKSGELADEELKNNIEVDSLGLGYGLHVLAKKKNEWLPGTIIDILKQDDKTKYKVRYDLNRGKSKVQANHIARLDTSKKYLPGQIPPGSRIAAHFKDEGIYSGIVAEAPDRKTNKGRFLIFFDDGYAMYCHIDSVYLVYGPPVNVWEDITYKSHADYIQQYLSNSEHPMVTMRVNQVIKVEFNGEWHRTKCVKVDCSLVEVMYLLDGSKEWIYRGSRRLEPLYKQSQLKMKAQQNKTPRRFARAHTGVRNAHIEYTTIDLTRDSSPSPTNSPTHGDSKQLAFKELDDGRKYVGKKSTGGVSKNQFYGGTEQKGPDVKWKAPWARSLAAQKPYFGDSPVTKLPQSFSEIKGGVDVASHILDRMGIASKQRQGGAKRAGKFNKLRDEKRSKSYEGSSSGDASNELEFKPDKSRMRSQSYMMMAPRRSASYKLHLCGPRCVEAFKVAGSGLTGINPLMKPLYLGWTREVSRMRPCTRGPAFHVYYRAPCGRMCRNMSDVDRYMLETRLTGLDYDQFCFDFSVRTHSNMTVQSRYTIMDDYAGGEEDIPIPCVNEVNMERPPVMPYTKARIEGEGVRINTSPDFMVCCDCKDNCRNRFTCPCQQLTVSATSCSRGAKIKQDAGYSYKRLYSFLPTGIYECNSNCKCNSSCLNRVVQKGLQCRLQMFKTHKKGWGIRCLDDIAKGTFVCIYTGKIQTEDKANEEGLANGDEYLAELDHIEVAERQKDVEDDGSSSGVDSDMDDDLDDDEKLRRNDSSDSGANTTDSDTDTEEKTKHVTVTLKRASDSNWRVKSDDSSFFEVKPNADVKRERGRRKLSDSDFEVSNFTSRLAPPGGENGDDDDETTDTDNDNSRPSSVCGTASASSKTSQSIGLHSSKVGSGGSRLSSDSSDDEYGTSQTRKYFGCPDTFIIDAKETGNLGRYLNHSCSPNLLVQNVFIDTHDLRFPWVAFFALSTIRAGTELTWDYNYEIGSVEGREIQCYCGATKCRKRLL